MDPLSELHYAMAMNSHEQDLTMLEKPKRKRNSSGNSSVDEGHLMHALSSAMDAFPREERVQLSCLKVMRHILPLSSNQPAIANSIKPDPLAEQQFTQSTRVDDRKMADSDDEESEGPNHSPLDYETMVELVLRAMQACPNSTRLHHLSVSILSTLCESQGQDICNAIIDMEGLIRLSETMTFHRDSAAGSLAAKLMVRLTETWNEQPVKEVRVVIDKTASQFTTVLIDPTSSERSVNSTDDSFVSAQSTTLES